LEKLKDNLRSSSGKEAVSDELDHILKEIRVLHSDIQDSEQLSDKSQNTVNAALLRSGEPVHRRDIHSFLSPADVDEKIANNLYDWLHKKAGIEIVQHQLVDGVNKSTALLEAIPRCRSIIILLSRNSVSSGWVKEEYYAARSHKAVFDDFNIVPVRIEECNIPDFLDSGSLIKLSEGILTLDTMKRIIERLYYRQRIVPRPAKASDLYVSRGWTRKKEQPLADCICTMLHRAGFRLIGDAEDQKDFDPERVKSIQSSCRGLVAIVPDRGKEGTSPFILDEIHAAQSLQLPCLIIAEPNVNLEGRNLEEYPIIRSTLVVAEGTDQATLKNCDTVQEEIEKIREYWTNPGEEHYVFLATDFKDENKERNAKIKDHIELVTSMACETAHDYKDKVRETITQRIAKAYLVIADISDNNPNTLIEAGIAQGTGRKLRLVARVTTEKDFPPYMLDDGQIEDYADDNELFAKVHKIAYKFRRRVVNYELGTNTYF
jgi:TIR domain